MSRIAESELIISPRGAIYHLDLRPEEIASTVITVGDPDRVKEVSKYFDSVEVKRQHREFISHTGYVGKKRLTVLSSGIGPDNIDIVMNELDALANIDFETREIKKASFATTRAAPGFDRNSFRRRHANQSSRLILPTGRGLPVLGPGTSRRN